MVGFEAGRSMAQHQMLGQRFNRRVIRRGFPRTQPGKAMAITVLLRCSRSQSLEACL
jgi:hypothetical protein